jgi:hypothetical protein
MNVLRSVAAVVSGLFAGYLVDRWVVFPAILLAAGHLAPGEFTAHRMAYGAIMLVVEVGTATLCSGVAIGLLAPARPRAHAVVTGVIGGLGALLLGSAGRVPQGVRLLWFAVNTILLALIASRVARWRDRSRLPVSRQPDETSRLADGAS